MELWGINNKIMLVVRDMATDNFDNFQLRSLIGWYLHVDSA